MAKSPLGQAIHRAHQEVTLAHRMGISVAELHDRLRRPSRRRFLAGTAGVMAATMLPVGACSSSSLQEPAGTAAAGLRVVVVGAGLAGLTCAYRLARQGAEVTLYEASDRAGGRSRTIRDFFADERTGESGGEFINSDHRAIRNLVRELGLSLEDLWDGYPAGTGSASFFDGEPYPRHLVLKDWSEVAPAIQRDFEASGSDVRWDNHVEGAIALDRMPLAEWLELNVPGGRASRLGRLIEVNFLSEWAGPIEDQSAQLLIQTVGPGARGSMDLLGGQDARWHVEGGSDRVASRLVEELGPGSINYSSTLVAVSRQGSGVRCSFDQSGTVVDADADRAVLALPFTALRNVDLHGAEFSDRKRRVIAEQPMGTNAKLHLEFSERAWQADGFHGDSSSDTNLGVTWEEVITEPGPAGILVAFTGGERGAGFDVADPHAAAAAELVAASAPDLENVFGPATVAAATGRGWLDSWADNPFVGGSYSYWSPGQFTELRGAGGTAEGPFHFCGEHTSLEFQGFMNGGVESGERAAAEIISG